MVSGIIMSELVTPSYSHSFEGKNRIITIGLDLNIMGVVSGV